MDNKHLSPSSQRLIQEAEAEIKARRKLFYQAHGFTEDEVHEALKAHAEFKREDEKVNKGLSFWDTPFAQKAFVAGYIYGKRK